MKSEIINILKTKSKNKQLVYSNTKTFFENLKNSVDMVTENKHKNPNIPNRSGKIKNRDYFDNLFFNINIFGLIMQPYIYLHKYLLVSNLDQ